MGQDDKKLEELRNYARTTLLETQSEEKVEEKVDDEIAKKNAAIKLNLLSQDVLEETNIQTQKEEVKEIKEVENQEQVNVKSYSPDFKAYKEKFGSLTINDLVKEQVEETESKNELNKEEIYSEQEEVQTEIQNEQLYEEKNEIKDSIYDASLLETDTKEQIMEEELDTYSNSNTKSYKFKFRLLTGVFCCIMAILTGWIIGNAIEISTTTSQIGQEVTKQGDYNVNIADYMNKIRKLDDNMKNSENGNEALSPIEDIIPITPEPLDNPTEYEEESNWFDKLCNWFRNLFGG